MRGQIKPLITKTSTHLRVTISFCKDCTWKFFKNRIVEGLVVILGMIRLFSCLTNDSTSQIWRNIG